jgi:hypothetical protein
LVVACDDAEHRVPAPLASRLWAFASREDEVVRSLPYDFKWSGRFLADPTAATGEPLELSMPPGELDGWPAASGHAISREPAAWSSTARQVYLDRARELADHAVAAFFGESPLPRASTKTEHYESITGAGTLALALVELHLHILYITAVKWPPNSADR